MSTCRSRATKPSPTRIVHGNRSNAGQEGEASRSTWARTASASRVRDEGEGSSWPGVDRSDAAAKRLLRAVGAGSAYLMRNIMDSMDFKGGGRVVELKRETPTRERRCDQRSHESAS